MSILHRIIFIIRVKWHWWRGGWKHWAEEWEEKKEDTRDRDEQFVRAITAMYQMPANPGMQSQ